LVRRNLAGGESVMPTGQLPLSVVVGRADMTDVVVRGKTLDLVGTARENVARFEVK
jgi:cytoskeleton protein RodZ